MKDGPWNRWSGPFLSGTALWLAFPDFALFFLAWLGLVPFLRFLLQRPSWGRLLAGHFIFGIIYFGGVLYWIPGVLTSYGSLGRIPAAAVFLLMLLVLALFLLPFSLLTRLLAARSISWALVCAPSFWILTELLRNHYAVDGFPWAALAYSQYPYSWLIQIADVGGVYLVSFLIVAGNCALLFAVRCRRWSLPLVFLGLMLAANLYGLYRVFIWRMPAEQTLKVALVQPNIELTGTSEYFSRVYFQSLPREVEAAAGQGVDWVILPEAPNPFRFGSDRFFTSFWKSLVAAEQVPLLFNGTWVDPRRGRTFNSAFLLDRSGVEVYRYDKIHLVPFGEYLPYGPALGFAQPLVREVGTFFPGTDSGRIGRVKGVPFATLICYECIFPELSRKAVAHGAQLLVNVTNDSWFGRTAAPEQHLQMAAFRALELRKPLLRCANSGYTALVDPLGRIRKRSSLFEKETLVVHVTSNHYRSAYLMAGDGFSISLIIVSMLVAAAVAIRKRAESPEPVRR